MYQRNEMENQRRILNSVDVFIKEFKESLNKDKKNKNKDNNIDKNQKEEIINVEKGIELAKRLVQMLSKERAKIFEQWIELGCVLSNISPTLLDTFKQFSEKAQEKLCDKVWLTVKNESSSVTSLRYWAIQDDCDAYDKLQREYIGNIILKAEYGTEMDVAKIVYERYKCENVCIDIDNDSWYEFQNHIWIKLSVSPISCTKIMENVMRELLLNSVYCIKEIPRGDTLEVYLTKIKNSIKMMENFKKLEFRERVIKECHLLFFDPKFEAKLDSNKNLVGYNNGIYDIRLNYLRAGTPDDLVSITLGYNYNIEPKNEDIKSFSDSVDQLIKTQNEYNIKNVKKYKEVIPINSIETAFDKLFEKNVDPLSAHSKLIVYNEQNKKCANSPNSKIRGLGHYKCDLYISGDGTIPLKSNSEPNGECDHIKPKAIGGTNDKWNLQYLCQFCHAEKTITDNKESNNIKVLIKKSQKIEISTEKFNDLVKENDKLTKKIDILQLATHNSENKLSILQLSNDELQKKFNNLTKIFIDNV